MSGYYKYIVQIEKDFFRGFEGASTFPQNTLTHVELQKRGDRSGLDQACGPKEDLSRNNDCFCIHNSGML